VASLGPLLKPIWRLFTRKLPAIKNRPRTARNRYLDAIASAQAQDYTLLTGHIHECLGDLLYSDRSDSKNLSDLLYYAEAQRLYALCHADAKITRLQERYSNDTTSH